MITLLPNTKYLVPGTCAIGSTSNGRLYFTTNTQLEIHSIEQDLVIFSITDGGPEELQSTPHTARDKLDSLPLKIFTLMVTVGHLVDMAAPPIPKPTIAPDPELERYRKKFIKKLNEYHGIFISDKDSIRIKNHRGKIDQKLVELQHDQLLDNLRECEIHVHIFHTKKEANSFFQVSSRKDGAMEFTLEPVELGTKNSKGSKAYAVLTSNENGQDNCSITIHR